LKFLGLEITRVKKLQNVGSTHTRDFFAGIDLQNDSSTQMKLSTVYRCVEVLSNSMAKMPFFIVDTSTHKKPNDLQSKQIKYLLNVETNKVLTPYGFHKVMEFNRLYTGNAYALIQSNMLGQIEGLWVLNPNSVIPKQLQDGSVVYDVSSKQKGTNTKEITTTRYLASEIIHLKGFSTDGLVGQSVLTYASLVTQNLLLQEQYARDFYKRGGRPIDIISPAKGTPMNMTRVGLDGKPDTINGKNDYDRWQEQVIKINDGSLGGKTVFLPTEAVYEAVPQISMKDMSFIEAKETGIRDIARFFGVPEYKLYDGKQSYESNEQNAIAYVTDTLNPILIQYEQEYTRKLLSQEKLLNGFSVKGNLNAEMRGDLGTRSDWYTKTFQIGMSSINENRELEDLEAVEGGEQHYISLNYAPIDIHTKWWEARVAQANDSHLQQTGGQQQQGGNTSNNKSKK